MKPIIEIQNVSKRFLIGHERMPYYSLRDRISSFFDSPVKTEEFWALRDISFDIEAGSSIGIIGRNGAGKSTLLKILSRITPPTSGRIVSRGRIASLLEVGTGFHQELTGRENIFMNGSILGMKNSEIKARFDDIVNFSGSERFLDTPLKHYSSGMQLRLAFAVAAHLEPEILIIDEVLAVGDAEFQKKCLGKMQEVVNEGRTILFVSHNLSIIQQLCDRSVWLDKGQVRYVNKTHDVIEKYIMSGVNQNASSDYELGKGVSLSNLTVSPHTITSLGNLEISFELKTKMKLKVESIGFFITNLFDERVGILDLRKDSYHLAEDGSLKFKIDVKDNPLIEGTYRLGMFFGSNLISDNFSELYSFQVLANDRKNGLVPYPVEVRGKVEFNFAFEYE